MIVALVLLGIGGVFLLERAEAQTRDTTRKHHLADIETALYFARGQHGTYPPYDQTSWCGRLSDPSNAAVLTQIETALREQHEKYANPAKPFPQDPLYASEAADYFYWKRSPANFELFSVLEADPTAERSSRGCPTATPVDYDYGIQSVLRQTETQVQL